MAEDLRAGVIVLQAPEEVEQGMLLGWRPGVGRMLPLSIGRQRMISAIALALSPFVQKSANCRVKNQPTVASKYGQLSCQNTANWLI